MSAKLTKQGTRPALSCPARGQMSTAYDATLKFDLSNLAAEPIVGRHYWATPGRST